MSMWTDRTLDMLATNFNFWRDSLDRLRRVNDGGHVWVYDYWGYGNAVPGVLHDPNSRGGAVDAREQHRMEVQMAAMETRNRWVT